MICGLSGACQPVMLEALHSSLGAQRLTPRVAVQCETPNTIAELATRDYEPPSAAVSMKPAVLEVFALMGLSEHHDADAEHLDHEIRTALQQRGQSYCVLYGSLQERVEQLLAIIAAHLARLSAAQSEAAPANRAGKQRAWIWMCDKCSDPQCEHRLLTDLLASRSAGP